MECKYLTNKNKLQCDYLTEHVNPNGYYITETFCNNRCKGQPQKFVKKDSKDNVVLINNRRKKRAAEKNNRDNLLADLPSGIQLAKNLYGHLKEIHAYYKQHGVIYTDDDEERRRLDICQNCPDNKMVVKDGVMRCTLQSCGCYLDNPKDRKILGGKTKYEAMHCDNGHW